jgi:hypothetical protein
MTFRGCTHAPRPAPVGPAELAFWAAVLREAKLMKLARVGVDYLEDAEMDIVLAAPMGFHAALLDSWEGRTRTKGVSSRPCARCGDPGGRPHDRCTSPGRTSGSRFGIGGDICLRCYDILRYRQGGVKNMNRTGRVPLPNEALTP